MDLAAGSIQNCPRMPTNAAANKRRLTPQTDKVKLPPFSLNRAASNMKSYHSRTGKFQSSADGNARSELKNGHYFHQIKTLTEDWKTPVVPRSVLDRIGQ